MPIFHPTIFYIHLKSFFKFIGSTLKNPTWRRLIFTFTFVIVWFITIILFTVLRLLDEIFFFGYRKQKIEKPVFIIANPRSGTTYMHRLLCMDENKFVYCLLYHTVFPSICFYKFIKVMGVIDRAIGSPMRKVVDWLDEVFFGGWKDVHPMGFNKSEEDEALFTMTTCTGGLYFAAPYMVTEEYLKFPDILSDRERRMIMKFYKNTLQRLVYSEGSDRIFLSKNVLTTGRVKSLLEVFPDARIIYLVRNPLEAVPSFISMFGQPWKFHSPEIPDNSQERRDLGQVAIDYYKYFSKMKDEVPPSNFLTLRYEDLVEDPKATVLKVYEHFGMDVGDEFMDKLNNITKRSKNYKSKHSYSLEQYGMTSEYIYSELPMIFDTYHFEHDDGAGAVQ